MSLSYRIQVYALHIALLYMYLTEVRDHIHVSLDMWGVDAFAIVVAYYMAITLMWCVAYGSSAITRMRTPRTQGTPCTFTHPHTHGGWDLDDARPISKGCAMLISRECLGEDTWSSEENIKGMDYDQQAWENLPEGR